MKKDIDTLVYELTGRAGTICHETGHPDDELEMIRFLKTTDEELEILHKSIVAKSGMVVNWSRYCEQYKKDHYNRGYREYLKSPAWKRKKAIVMKRAERSCMPESPEIRVSYDHYGRRIESIAMKWKPICENEGCQNEAKHVHHLHYETLGKEDIHKDLKALCEGCHNDCH